jgi:hypothetical protein
MGDGGMVLCKATLDLFPLSQLEREGFTPLEESVVRSVLEWAVNSIDAGQLKSRIGNLL